MVFIKNEKNTDIDSNISALTIKDVMLNNYKYNDYYINIENIECFLSSFNKLKKYLVLKGNEEDDILLYSFKYRKKYNNYLINSYIYFIIKLFITNKINFEELLNLYKSFLKHKKNLEEEAFKTIDNDDDNVDYIGKKTKFSLELEFDNFLIEDYIEVCKQYNNNIKNFYNYNMVLKEIFTRLSKNE